jgi:hypothetical protein
LSDDPTNALPTPSEPAGSAPSSGRRWKAAAIAAGVLVVVLAIALVQKGSGSGPTKNAATNSGSVTSTSAGSPTTATAAAANGGKSNNGVVQVDGGGQNVGTKPTLTVNETTTSAPAADTTTTTTSAGTGTTNTGGGIRPPIRPLPTAVIQPIEPIEQPARLDYQAGAKYGEMNMGAGFTPDPASLGFNDGGTVNVSYLGSGCTGFASVDPTITVNYAGGGNLLRLYIVGQATDSAMVVNDPYGNFYCVDNSFGTVNPTIDFNHPAGGTYNVWAASPQSGASFSGTFYATGNSGNHP